MTTVVAILVLLMGVPSAVRCLYGLVMVSQIGRAYRCYKADLPVKAWWY